MNARQDDSSTSSNSSGGIRARWAKARESRWFRWAFDIGLIMIVFALVSAWQARDLINKNEPAPGFTLSDMSGQTHQLSDYEGERTFLVFWAPWCAVCGAESDNVGRVQSWLGDGLNVVSVVLDYQNRAEVQRFMDKQDVDYPVLLGTDEVRQQFNISAYPTLYVLNDDGTIRRTATGYTTTAGMLWRALL